MVAPFFSSNSTRLINPEVAFCILIFFCFGTQVIHIAHLDVRSVHQHLLGGKADNLRTGLSILLLHFCFELTS